MTQVISKIIDGKRVIVKKPELLAPAGDLEKLKTAIRFGADAVFLGGQEYGLRSSAGNFSIEQMAEGVEFAKNYGAKIYVTTNIYAHNENIEGLENYLVSIEGAGVTGIIVADPLIIETCKKVAPKLEIHLSTQQSLTNWKTAQYWKNEGLHRVVLAREVSFNEMKEMKERVDIEIEAFIHGAMCIGYSGRCTLSNHMTARDSNRGGCAQSCRWDYDLYDGDAPQFTEDDRQYAMSSKDLTLLEEVPKMIEIGIDSLKIEGRMKSEHYVATVVSVYRKLIDAYCADPDGFVLSENLAEELSRAANRQTAVSFFNGMPDHNQQMYGYHQSKTTHDFAGLVLDYDDETRICTLQQRNFFKPGQTIEFFGPNLDTFTQVVGTIWDEDGNELDAARHPLQTVKFEVEKPVKTNDMMRREI